jgi:hypothetical protein
MAVVGFLSWLIGEEQIPAGLAGFGVTAVDRSLATQNAPIPTQRSDRVAKDEVVYPMHASLGGFANKNNKCFQHDANAGSKQSWEVITERALSLLVSRGDLNPLFRTSGLIDSRNDPHIA